jgi:hypothetical protein
MQKHKIAKILLSVIVISISTGCGGGSGADGTVVQGTLTERGIGHKISQIVSAKHSAGETLENVKVCVAAACSVTDGAGQWGVNIESFSGGDLGITVEGHGINAQTTINLPATAKDVVIDLGRNGSSLAIEKLIIDGEDHSEHDHHG